MLDVQMILNCQAYRREILMHFAEILGLVRNVLDYW